MILRRAALAALVLAPLLLLAIAVGGVLFLRQGGLAPYRVPEGPGTPVAATPERLAEGEYLARLGNCHTCHTTRGGVPFAGGRGFASQWGTVYSTNLTPDPATGLGGWSVEEFRHAMRHGVSRRGVLYPAFPYAHFARLSDADLDALYAYLQHLPPVRREATPNRLDFPASWRPALVAWRMLTYRPVVPPAPAGRSPQWQRGRYLVDGLGHCAMCHSTHGALGALPRASWLGGGEIPAIGWYAPPLDGHALARFPTHDLAHWLRAGTSPQATAYGPMAEVVYGSLRYLRPDDALAIATYLKSLPEHPDRAREARPAPAAPPPGSAAQLYERHCADCHGKDGHGSEVYPPLVDSVAVTAPQPLNAVRMILYGGVAPTTALNPRPYSMPPFVQQLDSADIAKIANYIRGWGGHPSRLTAKDIDAMHGIVID